MLANNTYMHSLRDILHIQTLVFKQAFLDRDNTNYR